MGSCGASHRSRPTGRFGLTGRDDAVLAKGLWTWAVLWHTLAFAAGSACVYQSYRTLFSGSLNANWARVIRAADLQLWLSGIAIIGSGISILGWQAYLANLKLWTKSVLAVSWLRQRWPSDTLRCHGCKPEIGDGCSLDLFCQCRVLDL